MFDMTKPVGMSVIVGSIAAIIVAITIGLLVTLYYKKKQNR